jgi:hypothetical protein
MGKRRWRDYKTAAGRRPVKEFLEALKRGMELKKEAKVVSYLF